MKAFQFRFDAVLTLRRNKENSAKLLYAQAIQALQAEQRAMELLFAELGRCYKHRETLHEAYLNEERILFLRKEIRKQEERIESAKKIVQQSLDRFLDRRKKTQVMEKLKENDFQDYRKEIKRLELKQNDSLYTTHFSVKEDE